MKISMEEKAVVDVKEIIENYRNVDSFSEAHRVDALIRDFIINESLRAEWKFVIKGKCICLETQNENEQINTLFIGLRKINNNFLPYWQYKSTHKLDKEKNVICFQTSDVFKDSPFGAQFDYVRMYITFYPKAWNKIISKINQFNLKIVDYTEYCSFLENKINELNGFINALSIEKEEVLKLQQSILD